MKTESLFIQKAKREIAFHIGKNQEDNFEVIDKGSANDLWFHAKDVSSCHVVCVLPQDVDRKALCSIVKAGALLCKNNTSKLKGLKNVEVIYTQIKNIIKTDVAGLVTTQNTKTIIC